MAIELLGDNEAMTALGLEIEPVREPINEPTRRPVPGNTQVPKSQSVQAGQRFVSDSMDSQRGASRFATVNIPDIRYTENLVGQRDQSVTVDAAASKLDGAVADSKPAETSPGGRATSQRTLSSLQAIKNSIERQSTGVVEQVVDDLFRVDTRAKAAKADDATSDESSSDETESTNGVTLTPKAEQDCYLSTLPKRDRQIQPIAQNILDKFPVGSHSVIAFAGTERNEQLESVVAQSALELAETKKCRVLIIDSDVNVGHLTNLMRCENSAGLTDLSRTENSWETVIQPTCKSGVHFLPLGTTELPFPEKLSNLMKKVTPNFVGQYDYVIINVGDAHGAVAKLWSNHTNGTFLLVSMTETNQNIAKSAVAQLNSFGARLIGCVVSDVVS